MGRYLAPAGYRSGLAVGLATPDGRYLGLHSLITDTTAHPTLTACDLVGALAPLRVTVLECHVRSPGHLSGVVVVSQPADVHGLTDQNRRSSAC